MRYIAVIDADEKPVSCEFIGCNGNVAPYLIGATTNIKPLEQQPTPRNNLAESSQDCISRQEALKYCHIEYDDDGVGHRVIYAEDIEKLPPVTPSYNSINTELKPCEDVLDEIITQIEQTRDKDKIAEYPYNRCIRIVEEYKK